MSHSSTSVASTGSNCNIQPSETTLEGTVCEEELLGSPMKLSPSSKLQVNHGHFMASMNGNNIGIVNGKSTSPRGNGSNPASAVNGLGSSSPTKDANFTGAPGSGKVIEILHQQVDALTTANLQLTKQSNHLLEKLESHNTKEAKYLETISSLKHENENLNSMLNRKTRRVKDLDAELSQLKTAYENVNNSYQQLKTQLESEFAHEAALEEQCKYLKVQYDAIVDSQKRYRGHYENEVSQLREALDELTRSSEQLLSEQAAVLTKDQLDLDKKLNEYNGRFHRMELLQKEAICELNDKYDRMKSSLDIESWVTFYKQVRETALEYAKEMDVTLPPEFVENHGDEGYFVKKLQEQSPPPVSQFEINSPEVPPLQSISQLPSQLSSPPLRLPKNRVLTSKRSSFYGGTQPGLNSVVNTSSVLLPGVKRNGSVRSFHGRATSDVVSDTPTLYSSSRNASPIDLSQRNTLRQTSMQKYRKNQSSQFSSNK